MITLELAKEKIVRHLAPDLGEHMAKSAVISQLGRLGIQSSTLSPADLKKLLTAMGGGLSVFVGKARSEALIKAIANDLGIP